jgi:gliding motility-associated-like protein
LQRDGLGANGAGANALGFGTSVPAAPGYSAIIPSIAFEVDTWDNSAAGIDDIPQDHVAIHVHGNMATTIGSPTSALASGTDITDGLCHQIRVTWQPGINNIRIYFDSDPVPRVNVFYNMVGLVFAGNPMVWWGVTASAGGAAMTQRVCVGANFAGVGPDLSLCEGESAQLLGTGGVAYSWLPSSPILSNTAIQNPVFGPAAAGTYTVSAQTTNITGCTDRDTTIVTVYPNPVAIPGTPGNLCLGDSIQLGGPSQPNQSYAWSPSTGLSSTTFAAPWLSSPSPGLTNYALIVTDTGNPAACADTATVAITALDTPMATVTAVNPAICLGNTSLLTATASNGAAPYAHLWSNATATPSQVVSPPNTSTYTVSISDANNCTTAGTVTVVVNDTPTVIVTATPDTICAGVTSQLTATPIGGSPGYSFLWNSGGATATTTVAPLATGSHTVTVTDGLGCQGSASTVIVVNVSDSIDILNADTQICTNGSVQVQNTFSTAGIDTWTWSPPTGVSNPAVPDPILTPTATTTYSLSGLNSGTGCGYTDTLRITFVPLAPPNIALGPDTTICFGNSLLLDAGNPGFGHAWNTGDSLQQISATTAGLYAVLVYDTMGCGYQATDSLALAIQPLPTPQLIADTTICAGDSLQLQAGNFSGYAWSTGSNNAMIVVQQAGIYWVEVRDGANCTGTDTFALGVQALPSVSFGALAAQYCVLDPAVQLVGLPSGGIFSGAVSANGLFDPLAAGGGAHALQYVYSDSLGCIGQAMQSTMVALPPSPALAGPDLQGESQITLQAQPVALGTGSWITTNFPGTVSNPNSPNAILNSDSAGTFPLVWTVQNPPCPSSSDTVWVTFEGINIPTAFSPNDDGVNDVYFIRGLGGYPGSKLFIFNRWGDQVWNSEDYQNDWNGVGKQAQPLVDDTYFAVLEYGGKRVQTYVVLKRQ